MRGISRSLERMGGLKEVLEVNKLWVWAEEHFSFDLTDDRILELSDTLPAQLLFPELGIGPTIHEAASLFDEPHNLPKVRPVFGFNMAWKATLKIRVLNNEG